MQGPHSTARRTKECGFNPFAPRQNSSDKCQCLDWKGGGVAVPINAVATTATQRAPLSWALLRY